MATAIPDEPSGTGANQVVQDVANALGALVDHCPPLGGPPPVEESDDEDDEEDDDDDEVAAAEFRRVSNAAGNDEDDDDEEDDVDRHSHSVSPRRRREMEEEFLEEEHDEQQHDDDFNDGGDFDPNAVDDDEGDNGAAAAVVAAANPGISLDKIKRTKDCCRIMKRVRSGTGRCSGKDMASPVWQYVYLIFVKAGCEGQLEALDSSISVTLEDPEKYCCRLCFDVPERHLSDCLHSMFDHQSANGTHHLESMHPEIDLGTKKKKKRGRGGSTATTRSTTTADSVSAFSPSPSSARTKATKGPHRFVRCHYVHHQGPRRVPWACRSLCERFESSTVDHYDEPELR